jgi:hypothetical protein
MTKTIATEEKWVLQYAPWGPATWLCSDSFTLRGDADRCLDRRKKLRPDVQLRLVHRVTVTTVTEEVVE